MNLEHIFKPSVGSWAPDGVRYIIFQYVVNDLKETFDKQLPKYMGRKFGGGVVIRKDITYEQAVANVVISPLIIFMKKRREKSMRKVIKECNLDQLYCLGQILLSFYHDSIEKLKRGRKPVPDTLALSFLFVDEECRRRSVKVVTSPS